MLCSARRVVLSSVSIAVSNADYNHTHSRPEYGVGMSPVRRGSVMLKEEDTYDYFGMMLSLRQSNIRLPLNNLFNPLPQHPTIPLLLLNSTSTPFQTIPSRKCKL